jgi:hypothetical protein
VPQTADAELVAAAIQALEAIESVDVAEAIAHTQTPFFGQWPRGLQ